jgi:hypothetical protein
VLGRAVVQEENIPRVQVARQARDYARGIALNRVEATPGPRDVAQAEFCDNRVEQRIADAYGRAEIFRPMPNDAFNRRLRSANFPA